MSTVRSEGVRRYLSLGIAQGLAAWAAYAVVEFAAASIFFRAARPYARFTTWHWALTGELTLAYLAAGLVAGALSGLAVFLLRGKLPAPNTWVMEQAATLTLTIALILNLLTLQAPPEGWWMMLIPLLTVTGLLVAAIRSAAWSERLGLIANPWVVSGLFLGIGEISALIDMGVAGQLGAKIRLWEYLLATALLMVAAVSVLLGKRWRKRLPPDRVFVANWAAVALALALMAGGLVMGQEAASAVPAVPVAGHSDRPNVVLIVMDTARADHLSLYGYNRDTTPNLRKLAEDATIYTQATSASDITLSSHASIFTGMYVSWHGAYCEPPEAAYGRPLSPHIPTLAEMLKDKGYHTLGVAANLYLRTDFGLQRGFQEFSIPRPVPMLAAESWYMLRVGMRKAMALFADTSQFDRLYSRADAINHEFFTLLERPALAQAPFFAFFNYMDAHFPYNPPHPFERMFPGKDRGMTQSGLEKIQIGVVNQNQPLPPVYPAHAISQYDGGIAYIDSQIGQLVDWLKREKLYDDTMIVVTADHGEAFGEKRLFLHANSTYQNLLRVGLLVKYPHGAHKGVVDAPVSLIDIVPTVLAAAGLTAPATLQGKNLLDPAALGPREIYGESFPCPVLHPLECPGGCKSKTVISWPDKFISTTHDGANVRLEAYDLVRDPNEERNVWRSLNQTARQLQDRLGAWAKSVPQQAKAPSRLSREEEKRLKSLGYIQ